MGLLFAAVREARKARPNSTLGSVAVFSIAAPGGKVGIPENSPVIFSTQESQKEGRFSPREVPMNPVAEREAKRRVQGPLMAESGNLPVSSAGDPVTDRKMHSVVSSTQGSSGSLQLPEVSTPLASLNRPGSSAQTRGGFSKIASDVSVVPSDRDVNILAADLEERPLGRLPGPGTPSENLSEAMNAENSTSVSPAFSGPDPAIRIPPQKVREPAREFATGLQSPSKKPEQKNEAFAADSNSISGPVTSPVLADPSPPSIPPVATRPPVSALSSPPSSPSLQFGALENRLQDLTDRLDWQAGELRRIPRGAPQAPASPTVRIGQVEVFITAPAPTPKTPSSTATDRGFLSRNYLRRA